MEFYDSLIELNFDTNYKPLLLHTILHGTYTNNERLLEITFKFLRDTQRFVYIPTYFIS